MPYLLHHDYYNCAMHGTWEEPQESEDSTKEKLRVEFFRPLKYGQPLSPRALAMLPTPYRIGGPKGKPVPDIFGNDLGPWHVSDRVKDIIEDLEPGVHTFIPINAIKVVVENTTDADLYAAGDLTKGKQEAISPRNRKYFILHVQRVVKAVVLDETDYAGTTTAEQVRQTGSGTISKLGKCTLYASAIKGHHLWRGGIATYGRLRGAEEAFWNQFFASDELVSRLKEIGAQGWEYQQCVVKYA
ncbi:MAG: DUF1629 domain-containing protein [Hyphomicrobium sp.]